MRNVCGWDYGTCLVRGDDRRVGLVGWGPGPWGRGGWRVADGRVVGAADVLDVRAEAHVDLPVPWWATAGGGPVLVRGREGGAWRTDRGEFGAVDAPSPALPPDHEVRDADGRPVRFKAVDCHAAATAHPQTDLNSLPWPGDVRVTGHSGGLWRASDGRLHLPKDVRLRAPVGRRRPFKFETPIICVDGTAAVGHLGGGRGYETDRGPREVLDGPVPPGATADPARAARVLARVPVALRTLAHRECVSWHQVVTPGWARDWFGVVLPPELTIQFGGGVEGCPADAFLAWYCAFSAADLAAVLPPGVVDCRRRLHMLQERSEPQECHLWGRARAGDEGARRDLAELAAWSGDPARAALLTRDLAPCPHYLPSLPVRVTRAGAF